MTITITHPDTYGDVKEFFMLAQPELLGKPFQRPPEKTIELGIKLIEEEVVKELLPDLHKLKDGGYSIETVARIMDHIFDSIYVLQWTAIGLALPMDEYWKYAQQKNMDKFPKHGSCIKTCGFIDDEQIWYEEKRINTIVKCVNGHLIRRNAETGKVIKPKGWTPPDEWKFLYDFWSVIMLK